MAHTNSVGIMPGAATEKLPFVHSDFKPRSKFAKCFGGFKKFTKHSNGDANNYEGQKLPLIHYSVGDQRNLITIGAKNRDEKPEYPGFAGKKKLLKKKDSSSSIAHPAISGSFTRSQANAMKQYLSLPNLHILHQQSETGAFHNFRSTTNFERKRRQRHKDNKEAEFMNYLQRQQQQHCHLLNNNVNNNSNNYNNINNSSYYNNNNNNINHNTSTINDSHQYTNTNDRDNNMDSLFIVDDEDENVTPSNNTMVVGNGVKFIDPPTVLNQHESFQRCSPNSNNSNSFSADYEMMDPFTREVDKKLREARGKSGMKRDKRREPDHMRALGDVVTAERMHELLQPRKSEGPLTFEADV